MMTNYNLKSKLLCLHYYIVSLSISLHKEDERIYYDLIKMKIGDFERSPINDTSIFVWGLFIQISFLLLLHL